MSKNFCNILVHVSLGCVYYVTETVEAIAGSTEVVGALTYCTLLYSMSDLKTSQMNV